MVESSGSKPWSLKMTRRFSRGSGFIGECFFSFSGLVFRALLFQALLVRALLLQASLLQDRVISIVDEAGAHGFGVFDVAKGANLHAKQLVGGGAAGYERRILFFLEGVDQGIGVVRLSDCGDL